ncbi:hypothetical protein [Rhizobium sp. BK176]|uniref:hypothetical protein n=1 Tax=Rhizobium sp. BK176 TaxID=2587071 RepID=UPI00216AA2F6|nr:hypothetical protein [Rhizobium sp. BK176]MCS4089174.1 hypothetical protein [Rhizobium sp. BK176]
MDEPEFEMWDIHPLIPILRFADVEASGIHEGSYPLEFGWCGIDLVPSAILVRPEPGWTTNLFDPNSYEMHGISYDMAKANGEDADAVAHRLNAELQGKAVVTDNVYWDGVWTARLAETTGVPMRFGYNDSTNMKTTFSRVYDPWCVERRDTLYKATDRFYPHTHRADADSLRMAARTRMLIDREWAQWLLDRPNATAQPSFAGRTLGR